MTADSRPEKDRPDRIYEVRVNGLVPADLLTDELADVDVVGHELRTVVSVRFADQAALHTFLHRLRTFGLELVEVRRVNEPDDPPES